MAKRKNDAKDPDEDLLCEAKERFQEGIEFEGDFRKLFTEDLKFVKADPDNGYQWPDSMLKARQSDERPALTINKTRQHCLMVINEAKEAKPSIKLRAVGGDASYESAQVYEGLARHIEYQSNAADAYDTALEFAVWTGIGYWRVVTEYAGDDSFDQEIYIRRIRNPLSVVLDPMCKEADGSDAQWCFIFDDMTREAFERKYPKFKDQVADGTFGEKTEWIGTDHVRVAEYYYTEYSDDWLYAVPMPDGVGGEQITTMTGAELKQINAEFAKAVHADDGIKRRKVQQPKILWCLIAGDTIIDRSEWAGTTIPIARVPGEETLIDGKLDRKGHVRNIKDPQRMYNFWASSAVEYVALQGKTPYIVDTKTIEGLETYWDTANTDNHAYLPYNSVNQNGDALAPPQRLPPPQMSQAYLQGMQSSAEEMKMVSGQNDPLMGAPSNEISGVAIGKRAKQGDRATMHYRDSVAKAIRRTGKILIEVIPRVYDTARTVRILAEDGSDDTVKIDPNQQQPMTETPKDQNDPEAGVNKAFNPARGKYEVVADSGPGYATKREEAFDAMVQLAAMNPQFLQIAGDLFMRSADFPMAEELAERFANSIPDAIKGTGPTQEVQQLQGQAQQLQQQIQQLQGQLSAAMQTAADESARADDKAKNTEVNAYKAMTDRLEGLLNLLDPLQAQLIAQQAVNAALSDPSPRMEDPQNAPRMAPDPMTQQIQPPIAPPPMPPQPPMQ